MAHEQQPQTEWPQMIGISGYHPVSGKVQEMAYENLGQTSHKAREPELSEDMDITDEMVASGDNLGATQRYEILEPTLADIFP